MSNNVLFDLPHDDLQKLLKALRGDFEHSCTDDQLLDVIDALDLVLMADLDDCWLFGPADQVIPKVITPIWHRPWCLFAALIPGFVPRWWAIPKTPPLSKADVLRSACQSVLQTHPDITVALVDADVLLSHADLLALLNAGQSGDFFGVLSGGPEVVGTFAAHIEDIVAALPGPGLYRGWGFEDLHAMANLVMSGLTPSFITPTLSLAFAHSAIMRTWAQLPSPGVSLRTNQETFQAAFGEEVLNSAAIRVLYTHAAKEWRVICELEQGRPQ